MSYAGWVLVLLAAVIVGYLTPMLIRRRQSLLQTPVEDRFSTGSHIVDMDHSQRRVRAEQERKQPQLLAHTRVVDQPALRVVADCGNYLEGESEMSARNQSSRPDAIPSASREMARLRAQRAARIAREDAAGKRRFAVVAASLTAFVALAVMAFQVSLSPWWLLVPTAVAALVVVDGRLAYRRSVAAAEAESEQLQLLRAHRQSVTERRTRVRTALKLSTRAELEKQRQEVAPQVAETQPEEGNGQAQPNDEVDATEAAIATGWTARELPPPTYATAPRLPRREVSAEALEEASGEVQSTVASPRRPVSARPTVFNGQSTQEVKDSLAVAFDLEDVLELRRAQ